MAVDVYESTDFEVLWQQFARTLRAPLADPLAPEVVVVPSRGWESWISRRLAGTFGCQANTRFLLTGQWLSEVLEHTLGGTDAPRREADSLTWMIATRLPGLLDDPVLEPVRRWLLRDSTGSSPDPRRLIDLSRSIGRLFDQYLLFRPQLIDAWQQGRDWPPRTGPTPPDAPWQARLWRRILADHPFRSVMSMTDVLRERLLAVGEPSDRVLPERVTVWLSGGIAPAHLRFFETVGLAADITLLVLAPATEYWGDMQGRRRLLKQLRQDQRSLREFCGEHHVELLHPLLASLGESSRQQQMLLADCDAEPWRFHDDPAQEWDDPDDDIPAGDDPSAVEATLLRTLQTDIRRAREPSPRRLPRDASLRIHSAHSALREVEILREQIRDALESDPDLTPDGILVLCPALDDYAPLIHAVFGTTRPGQPGHIPYHVAGGSPRTARPVIDAWLRLLELLPGRFAASRVLDLLSTDPVRQRAGLTMDDVESLGEWISDAGIRWGLNATHRSDELLPASDLNTWQFGLDRLLLGYALPPGGGQLVDRIASLDRAEGLAAAPLGRLWQFMDRLAATRQQLQTARTLADWQITLAAVAEQFLAPDDDEPGFQILLDALDQLAELAAAAGFTVPVALPVVAKELELRIDQSQTAMHHIGGITFCPPDALRSLPFDVVAMLGLNDGEFPGGRRPVGYDLQRFDSQPGDRDPRDQDRHLFLEALLSARRRLILTCQGQDIRDARPRPPSVLIQELLDVLDQTDARGPVGSGTPPPVLIRSEVVISHPLQAFSPRYFNGSAPHLISYAEDALTAARRLCAAPEPEPPFVPEPLSQITGPSGSSSGSGMPAIDGELRVDDLRRLVQAPWKLFLDSLGLGSLELPAPGSDREPLLLDGLETWRIGSAWLDALRGGIPLDNLIRSERRSGRVPAGPTGDQFLSRLSRTATAILGKSAERNFSERSAPLSVDLTIDGTRITGQVPHWTGTALQGLDWSKLTSRQALQLWLSQLLVTAHTGAPVAEAVLLGQHGSEVGIASVEPSEALAHLTALVRLARLARRWPLPFFADDAVFKPLHQRQVDFDDPGSLHEWVAVSRRAFELNSSWATGPGARPDAVTAFRGLEPFALRCAGIPELAGHSHQLLFVHLAREIILPMLPSLTALVAAKEPA